ncbi:HCLS1-associated protein X-1 [Anolis sagrei]|uniref:HCLS1-associated protein X-1 n=1 Tax=Anolis sagrei TaxID=38937 RepID=UPI00352055D8
MSVYDLFRGFFGFQGGNRPRDPFFGGITREEDEEDDDEDDEGGPSFGPRGFGSFGGFGFPFGPGGMRFHDAFGFEELFRDFNDLFSDMGAVGLPSRPLEMPGLEAPPPPGDPSLLKRRTLRDSMLKYPDSPGPQGRAVDDGLRPPSPEKKPWPPFQAPGEDLSAPAEIPKEDGDLDSRVRSEGLRTVLPPPSQPRSYFQSVSVTKVVAPDGTVEERRTVRDSQGHEETVVTRRSGAETLLDRPGRPRREEVLGDTPSLLDIFFGRWFR